jgi:hypothetical protein
MFNSSRSISWLCHSLVRYSLRSRKTISLFISLVYCAEITVRWFVVREKHCWMAAGSADKSKRTGCVVVGFEFLPIKD